MDVSEIRHRNLLWLLDANKATGRSARAFGQRAGGIGQSMLSQLKAGKPMGNEMARRIDAGLGKPRGWMDNPQWEAEAESSQGAPDDLAKVVEAQGYCQAFLMQALAATIPTAARDVLGALDNKLPQDLREIGYIQVLRNTILGQLARNDMASLRAAPSKAPAAPQRKRR